jgi:polysaccharide export outer membrane protein
MSRLSTPGIINAFTDEPHTARRGLLTLTLLLALLLLSGCTPPLGSYRHSEEPIVFRPPVEQHFGNSYPHQPAPPSIAVEERPVMQAPKFTAAAPVPLSPGDRIQLTVQNGKPFSGLFEVDIDGALKIPFLPAIRAYGRTIEEVEETIRNTLIDEQIFRRGHLALSARVQLWAPIQVHVGGAVFNPGMVSSNVRSPDERAQKTLQQSGDFPIDRLLPAALRAAGGVRPDASLEKIKLIRNGEAQIINLSGIMSGYPITPVALMSGDTIIVPSSGRFDSRLVAPSSVTPPGIRIFISSLTTPAPGNASAAIEKHATSIPYGSRLLTAAVSANCVGGTNITNGSRYVLLVRTDPLTGREEALKRPIDELLLSPERNEMNPFMMPNDSVACYDSGVTNLRDIGRSLTDILMPFTLLMLL